MPNTEPVNIVITAVDNASKILTAVGQAFNMISGSLKNVTGSYMAYGDQVRKLSDFVGTSSEQTSRMIQLADDAFVSFETLRLASKNLSEKGIQPTAENMGKLSNQFLKLAPGLERSQFLIDNFGRAGMEMVGIMQLGGEKIKVMNAAIESGLIIDDKKAAAIYKTKQQLDQFNDSLDAMKYDVAGKLLDIFGKMPEPLRNATLYLNAFLSPTNINTMIQFGILLKGVNMAGMFTGIQNALLLADTAVKVWAIDAWAAIAPTMALIAPFVGLAVAIGALIYLINSGAASAAFQTLQKLMLIGELKTGMIDNSRFMDLTRSNGLDKSSVTGAASIIPGSSSGGGPIVINYQPTMSTANQDEASRFIASLMPSVQRLLGR